jgi:Transglutaminase-like superfamily
MSLLRWAEPLGRRVRVSAREPLGRPARLLLGWEIAIAYLAAHRELRGTPIAQAVANLRGQEAAARPAAAQQSNATLAQASRLGRAVLRTLAILPGDTRCLARSLVLTRLLARREIPATLVIGARTSPEFLAHAWVECSGVAVLPTGDGSFGRLVEL